MKKKIEEIAMDQLDLDDDFEIPFELESEEEDNTALEEQRERHLKTREKLRKRLRNGEIENRPVEINMKSRSTPFVEIFSPGGIEEMDINFKDMFSNILAKSDQKNAACLSLKQGKF